MKNSLCILAIAALFTSLASIAPAQTANVRITEGPNNNEAEFIGTSAIDYPMLQVSIQNQSALPLEFQGLQITASGDADDTSDITLVELYADLDNDGEAEPADMTTPEPQLATGTFAANNGTLQLTASTPQPIGAGETRNFLIIYQMAGTALDDETLRISVESNSDVQLVVVGGGTVSYQANAFPVNGLLKTIGSGQLAIDLLPDSVNNNILPYFLAGFSRSEAMRLRLRNSGDERISLNSIRIDALGEVDDGDTINTNGVQFVLLEEEDSDLTTDIVESGSASISGDDGFAVINLSTPISFARGEIKYAAIAIDSLIDTTEYGKEAIFNIPEGSFQASGLDSGVPQIDILGEGTNGQLRLYHGHGQTLAFSKDRDDSPVTRGSSGYPLMGFSIRNDKFEDVSLTSLTVTELGTANAVSDLSNTQLWIDDNNDGELNTTGDDPDTLVGSGNFVASRGATPTEVAIINFDTPLPFGVNAITRFIITTDLAPSITDGSTLQVAIASPLDVGGASDGSTAPVYTLNTPFIGSTRTVTANTTMFTELSANLDAKERRKLPRRQQTGARDIILWNFDFPVSAAENGIFESLDIALSGTVDDAAYLENLDLYFDKNNNGELDEDTDELIGTAAVTSNNQTVSILATDPPSDPFIFEKEKTHKVLVMGDLTASTLDIYDDTLQMTIPTATSFRIVGDLSGLPIQSLTAPFVGDEKPILQPFVTLMPGPTIIDPTNPFQTCINNGDANLIQFRLLNDDVERVEWQSVSLSGASSLGQSGLDNNVVSPWIFLDKNSDFTINGTDIPMNHFTSGPSSHPFNGSSSTVIDLETSLGFVLPGIIEVEQERINMERGIQSTFTLSYALTSPIAQNGATFDATIPVGGLNLTGEISGDPVIIIDEAEMTGREQMTTGEVELVNFSSVIANPDRPINPGCPNASQNLFPFCGRPGDDGCTSFVNTMLVQTNTSIIERLALGKLDVNIQRSSSVSLDQVIQGAKITYKGEYGYACIAPLQVDFVNETLSFDPGILEPGGAGENLFYSFQEILTPNRFHIWLDVLPTAQGSLTLSIDQASDIEFSGLCSLAPSGQIPVTAGGDGFPIVSRTLVFGNDSALEFRLRNAREDVEPVAFPGNSDAHPVLRMRTRSLLEDEDQRLEGITFDATGTADDVAALLETDQAVVATGLPSTDYLWHGSGSALTDIDLAVGDGIGQDGIRAVRAKATWTAGGQNAQVSYRLPDGPLSLSGTDSLRVSAFTDAPTTPSSVRLLFAEQDGDVWLANTPSPLSGAHSPIEVALNAANFTSTTSTRGGASFGTSAITHIGARIENPMTGFAEEIFFDAWGYDDMDNNTTILVTSEAAAELHIGNAPVAAARFDADNGQLVFEDFEVIITQSLVDVFVHFNPSDETRSFVNNGQTFELTIPATGGVTSFGAASNTPVTNLVALNGVDQQEEPFPFIAPSIRIGAGRIFAETEQEMAFPIFHVDDATNVVSIAFTLKPDRAEDVVFEEIRIKTEGTLNELEDLDGSAVRLFVNDSPFNEHDPFDDIQKGVGEFLMDDGEAIIRFSDPTFIAEASRISHYLISLDLNGMAADFETFQHTIGQLPAMRGPAPDLSLQLRGLLSNELATPYYGQDDAVDPNLGFIQSAVHTIGRATLDFSETNDLPDSDVDDPTFILPGADVVPLISIEFEALEIENMNADSFTFMNRGSADETSTITGLRLYRDDNENGVPDSGEALLGSASGFSSDDETVTIPFDQAITIAVEEEDVWLLVADTSDGSGGTQAVVGESLQSFLDLAPETLETVEGIVGGTGLISDDLIGVIRSEMSSAPFEGPYYQFTPGIVDARRGSQNPRARDILISATDVPVFQARLRELFDLEDVAFNEVTFGVASPNGSNLDLALGNATFQLWRETGDFINGELDPGEDTLLTSTTYTSGQANDAGTLVFDLSSLTDIIERDTENVYLVTLLASNAPQEAIGTEFELSIGGPEALDGTGQTTQLAAVFELGGGAFESNTFTFNESTIRLRRDSGSPDDNDGIAPDDPLATLLSFTAQSNSASDIRLSQLPLQAVGTANPVTTYVANGITLVLDDGDETRKFDPADTVVATGAFDGTGRLVFSIPDGAPGSVIPAGSTSRYLISGALSGIATLGQTVGVEIPDEAANVQLLAIPDEIISTFVGTTFPITGGPTPLVARSITVQPPDDPLRDSDALPNATDVHLFNAGLFASIAENLVLNSATFTISGTADAANVIQSGIVSLYNDEDTDGIIDPADDLLGQASVNGSTLIFNDLDLEIRLDRDEEIIASASFNGNATLGQTIQLTLTALAGSGEFSLLPTQNDGLPYNGPTITFATPGANFEAPGSEGVDRFAYNNAIDQTLHLQRIDVSAADDLVLKSVEYDLLDINSVRGSTASSAIAGGSVRVALDDNRDGRFDASDDTVLAQGLTPGIDEKITVTGLNQTLQRDALSYLMLVVDYNGTQTNFEISARLNDSGTVIEAASAPGVALANNGLPFTGGARNLIDSSFLIEGNYTEDFEIIDNLSYAPYLEWQVVSDPTRALSGSNYVRAELNPDGTLPEAAYALEMPIAINGAAQTGGKEIELWYRYSFPSTSYRFRLQASINGGDSWSTLNTVSGGESLQWIHLRDTFSSAQENSPTLLLRALYDGGGAPNSFGVGFLEIDRITFQLEDPDVDIRNFASSVTGFSNANPTIPVSFDVRNRSSTPLAIDGLNFFVQDDQGTNLNGQYTVQFVSGDFNLPANTTVTIAQNIVFNQSVDASSIRIDVGVAYSDPAIGLPQPYVFDAADPIDLPVLRIFDGIQIK